MRWIVKPAAAPLVPTPAESAERAGPTSDCWYFWICPYYWAPPPEPAEPTVRAGMAQDGRATSGQT